MSRFLGFRWLCVASLVSFGVLTAVDAGDAPFWTAFDDIGESLAAVLRPHLDVILG